MSLDGEAPDAPITVKAAARFLGVSPSLVYAYVERKQIPHLRVMGRSIRFLKSDLEPFRASFRQEVVTRPIFCTNRSESLHRSLGL